MDDEPLVEDVEPPDTNESPGRSRGPTAPAKTRAVAHARAALARRPHRLPRARTPAKHNRRGESSVADYSTSNPADAPVRTLALTSNSIPLTQVEDLADTRLVQLG